MGKCDQELGELGIAVDIWESCQPWHILAYLPRRPIVPSTPSHVKSPQLACHLPDGASSLSVSNSNSSDLQLAAEASFLSFTAVTIILIWIAVRPTSFHVFVLFDEMLHSGTYDGTARSSQTVTGSYLGGLRTSTWSA